MRNSTRATPESGVNATSRLASARQPPAAVHSAQGNGSFEIPDVEQIAVPFHGSPFSQFGDEEFRPRWGGNVERASRRHWRQLGFFRGAVALFIVHGEEMADA